MATKQRNKNKVGNNDIKCTLQGAFIGRYARIGMPAFYACSTTPFAVIDVLPFIVTMLAQPHHLQLLMCYHLQLFSMYDTVCSISITIYRYLVCMIPYYHKYYHL